MTHFSIKVFREGLKSEAGRPEELPGAVTAVRSSGRQDSVMVWSFTTSAENERRSRFSAEVVPDDYEKLAWIMMETAPKAAMKAFAAAIREANVIGISARSDEG